MEEVQRLQQLAGLNEIKVNKPKLFNKISLDLFKQLMRDGFLDMITDLEFESPNESIEDFDAKLMGINEKFQFCTKLSSFLDDYGFSDEQFEMMICNNIIK